MAATPPHIRSRPAHPQSSTDRETGRAAVLRTGLARRITGVAATVVLITAFSINAAHLAIQHAAIADQRMARAQDAARNAAEIVKLALAADDVAGLDARLKDLAGGADVRRAVVYDDAGRIIASSDAAGLLRLGGPKDELVERARGAGQPVSMAHDGVLTVAAPVPLPGSGMAVLRVDAPLTIALAPLLAASLAPIGAGLVMGGLGIALMLIFVRRITQPLRVLAHLAQEGDVTALGVRADMRTGDEVEVLAGAFNRLIRRIHADMRRLQHIAFVDPLTQLSNRERLLTDLGAALKGAGQRPGQGAVVVIEISRFARVNETLGRARADELLQALAQRLASSVSVADRMLRMQAAVGNPSLLARTGSDEFTIHIPDIADAAQAGRFAQLVAGAMRQPVETGGHKLYFTVSCGVSVYPTDGRDTETVLRNAHLALAAARTEGAAEVRFFTQALDERAQARLQLETELREALECGQLVAYFQPKVDLTSDRIVSCEALARWRHPRMGVLGPSHFIQAAEQLGLMNAVGEAVLRAAAAAAARWVQDGHRVGVAVNVSMSQFADDRFPDRVLAILERTGLPCEMLELEMTESLAMENPDRVAALLAPLKKSGVRLAIDDFGAGHSSLAALTRLPFDVFKIDRQFVHALEEDPSAPAVIDTVLALARALDYETVAEGVETPAQAAFLRRRGCTLAQGYLFGRPMTDADFAALLAARQPVKARAAGL